jgi:hypothetical protein|tara:strand:- start:121 stop:408 length:288 start_codon:yes stop_codon:yes gene_type:complete
MNKFTNNQSSEETTAAYLYELEQAHRQEEQELAEIAEAQWEAFQDDHDTEFYDWVDEGIEEELDEHDLRVAQAEWEAEQDAPFGFMAHDDPDYWA